MLYKKGLSDCYKLLVKAIFFNFDTLRGEIIFKFETLFEKSKTFKNRHELCQGDV